MREDIVGDPGGAVPEPIRNDLRWCAGPQNECRRAVPQVVEAEVEARSPRVIRRKRFDTRWGLSKSPTASQKTRSVMVPFVVPLTGAQTCASVRMRTFAAPEPMHDTPSWPDSGAVPELRWGRRPPR